jgi:hypothetical protein
MKKEKRPLVDILANILYVMAMAMDRIVRVMEVLLKAQNKTWHRERKMRFNEMIKCANRIKALNNIIDYEDYGEALKGKEYVYQYYQEDAYKLARLILLFCDRDTVSEDNSNETFKLMRSQEGTGNIGEEELKFFYLNK